MNAGKLNKRIQLQSLSGSQDGFGQVAETYTTYDTVWAAVRPLAGKELLNAQQVAAETTHEVRIRYNSAVTTKHRILFGTRVFEINSVLSPNERKEEMVLMCKEGG